MSFVHHNTPKWIEENKKYFLPPVCNKMMHNDQLKVFYVGGPNVRKDFHIEEGEEFFFMVKGDMNLLTMEKGEFKDVKIKEGEVFLLPGKIPHSPQRYQDTVGLVIERERLKTEKDCLRYFVEGTNDTLFEKWFYCDDLGVQLGPIIKEYFASEQHKTGKPIPGTITTDPPWAIDGKRELGAPFSLSKWVEKHRDQINKDGKKRLFDESYKSDIFVVGKGEIEVKDEVENWLWQIEGESSVVIDGKSISLKTQDTLLISSKVSFKHSSPRGSLTLYVKMKMPDA